MNQNLYAKCANPVCAIAFDPNEGGIFFRFGTGTNEPPANCHGVSHYWLCSRCARIYTLACDESNGVFLRAAWANVPPIELMKELIAA
jgi:hypothetical protein